MGGGAWRAGDFEALERGCRRAALEIAGRVVAEHLNADRGDERSRWRCACGTPAPYAGRRDKTFTTALGPLTLSRAWYHCRRCGHGFSPRDRQLGFRGSLSPAVRRMVGMAAAETSFDHAATLLDELAGVAMGAKQVERHAEALGRDIARDEAAVVERAPAAAPTLYVGLDGTGVPVRKAETAGRKGKQADADAKTREAKLVSVWSAEDRDAAGVPRRDDDSASYDAAIESIAGKDTDHDPPPFAARVLRELERRGVGRAKRRVVLGDGAAWIWNFADEHLPDAIQIVDVFHAKEHVFEVAKAIHGSDSDLAAQWGKARRDELDRHGAAPVIAALRRHADRCDAARAEVDYFTRNRERMNYPRFRAQGLRVATGIVEGACKSVVGNRLKRGGTHWTVNGANAILALRCAIRSNRFDDYWRRRAAHQ